MKNKPVTIVFQGEEVISRVNIQVEKEKFTVCKDKIVFVKITLIKIIANPLLSICLWLR